jgi:hypothetical protein
VELTRRSISQDRRYLRLTVLPTRNLRAEEIDAFTARLRVPLDESGLTYLIGGAPVGGRDFTRALVDATPTAIAGRAAGNVPAAGGGVPLDRDSPQERVHELPVGGRGVRRGDARGAVRGGRGSAGRAA